MKDKIEHIYRAVLIFIHITGVISTFTYLTFFDGYQYTAWNWLVAIPVNVLLSQIWPIYWAILHWAM